MKDFKFFVEKTKEIGYVTALSHFVAYVSGLPGLKLEEMIITEKGIKGIVHSLEKKWAKVLILEEGDLKIGDGVARTNEQFKIPVSEKVLGRIVNPLCQPLDGLGPIGGEKKYLPIKREAPGIIKRKRIKRFLETGVMTVDVLVPIGYGQRELVIGDAKTGKTIFLLQAISSQVKKGVVCVYVAIGKESEAIKMVENYLKEMKAFEMVTMVVATSRDTSTLNYLAPFSGMTIAEFFRDKGKDVMIIFDDLTTHAKFYREISLLLKRSPGRGSYPGDIFHIQAALLERAGNIKFDGKEVSITALPVAETLENDISGFIQTNLMAMTDGHIFFDIEEFRRGKRPAINAFLSVSRVGNQTKEILDREISGWIKRKMASYRRIMEVARFGIVLPKETQEILELGKKMEILFEQGPKEIIPRSLQLLFLGLLISGFWEGKMEEIMKMEKNKILKNFEMGNLKGILEGIEKLEKIENLKDFIKEKIPALREIIYK